MTSIFVCDSARTNDLNNRQVKVCYSDESIIRKSIIQNLPVFSRSLIDNPFRLVGIAKSYETAEEEEEEEMDDDYEEGEMFQTEEEQQEDEEQQQLIHHQVKVVEIKKENPAEKSYKQACTFYQFHHHTNLTLFVHKV